MSRSRTLGRSFTPLAVAAAALCLAPAPALSHTKAADRDRDGMPDSWERRYDLPTRTASARRDTDRDGLSDRREYRLRTHPRRVDTDRDGLRDGAEVRRYRTNPRRRDTDRDGLDDRAEVRTHHTDPRKADTDGDGVPDGAEVRAGKDPRKAGSEPPDAAVRPVTGPPDASTAPPARATPLSVGVPAGWVPAQTRTSTLVVNQPGAVIEDLLLVDADVVVAAPNVTLRRLKLQGGRINNWPGATCANELTVEDTTLEPVPGQNSVVDSDSVLGQGGYTARRVRIWRRSEGFRVGGRSGGCGPVRIEQSLAKIVIPPGRCDLHSDGIQGYDGPALTIVDSTIDFTEAACGTAAFFVPDGQGNTSVDVDGLTVMGGGYPFRLGVPGRVNRLAVVEGSWGYGPVDVRCRLLDDWQASIVRIDPDYRITRTVRAQPCTGT